MPAGLPCGMPGIGELIDGAMQQAPQWSRHGIGSGACVAIYLAAATELSLRQRRRGLLMLVTNLRDEDSDDLLVAVRMLQRRHLVVVASLRERAIDEALDGDIDGLPAALRAAAAARYSPSAPPSTTHCAGIG